MIFANTRQAIAYLYAHHRGPTASRPKYHDAPGGTGRSHWDGALVGALLYGPRETGGCGVERGGPLDLALKHWSSTAGAERTGEIRAIDRRMRSALLEHRLLVVRRRVKLPEVRRWTDPEGAIWARLRRIVGAPDDSPCADGLGMPRVP